MGRRHRNPLVNPLHYATPQLPTGPPVTWAAAQRGLVGYDYGMCSMTRSMHVANSGSRQSDRWGRCSRLRPREQTLRG